MSKIFTTLILLSVFSLCLSQNFLAIKIERTRNVSVEITNVSPLVNMTLDLFHGLESSFNMSYMIPTFPRCEESYLMFWNHTQDALYFLKNGDYNNGVFYLGHAIGDVEELLSDCGNGTAELIKTVKELNDKIKSDPKAFYGNLTLRMASNSKEVLFTIAELVNYKNTAQYFKLGQTIGKLLKLVFNEEPAPRTLVLAAFNASDIELSNCLVELQYISTDLKDLLDALKADTFDNIAIAESLGYILESVPSALETCGFRNISSLANATLRSVDPLKCLSDVESLVNTGQSIVADVNASDYSRLLQDINALISEGGAFAQDCLGQNVTTNSLTALLNSTNIFACLSDLKSEVSEISQLVSSISSGNISAVISELQPLLSNTDQLISDCGLSNSSFANRLREANPQACISDLEGLLQLGNQIQTDAQAANVQALLNDIVEFVSEGQQTVVDCTGSNATQVHANNLKGVVQCILDVERTVENFKTLEADIQAENQTAVISDINVLVNDVNAVLVDCNANSSLIAESLKNVKPEGCAQDINDLRNLSRLILADYTSQDSQSLIAHVYDFITEAHQALEECGGKFIPLHLNRSNETKQCILSLDNLISNVRLTVPFVKSGNLSGLGNALEVVRVAAANASQSCNITDQISNRFIQSNPQQCLSDIETVVNDANAVSQDISTQDLQKAITDGLALVKAVQTAVADCAQSNITDAFVKRAEVSAQCSLDLLALKQNVSSFLGLLRENRTAAGYLLQGILNTIPQIVNDCRVDNQTTLLERVRAISPISCLEDVENLVQEAQAIVSDISSGNVSTVISQAIELFNTAQQTYADCAGQNLTEDFSNLTANVLTCVQDIETLVSDLRSFSNDVKTENISHIVSDVTALVNTGKAALNDCNFVNVTIPHYENLDRINPEQCANEIVILSAIARNITADVQAKNISNAVSDVKSIVNLGEAFVRDCAGFEFNSTEVQQCVRLSNEVLDNLQGIFEDLKAGDQPFDLIARFGSLSKQIPLVTQACKLNQTQSVQATTSRLLFTLNLESENCQSSAKGVIDMIPRFFSCTSTTEWATLTLELQGRLIKSLSACTSKD